MIEKLKIPKSINWDDTPVGMMERHEIIGNLYEAVNELVDAVNALVYEHDKDSDWYDDPKHRELVDIGELAHLQKENSELKDEVERTRKALAFAKSKLNGIHRLYSKAFYTREDWLQVCMEMVDKANTALEQITALEQKDVKCQQLNI